jgi:hypothetical protein
MVNLVKWFVVPGCVFVFWSSAIDAVGQPAGRMISIPAGNSDPQSADKCIYRNEIALISLLYLRDGQWQRAAYESVPEGIAFKGDRIAADLQMSPDTAGYRYRLNVEAEFDTRVRLQLELLDADQPFHLIPCNIYGDNNLKMTGPGEYPHLTDQYPEDIFCAPLWEFRADRSALPVSILCHSRGAVGISIDPYSEQNPDRVALNDRGFIRNGVFSALPAGFGVSLGYGNVPGSFVEKQWLGQSTCHLFRRAAATGRILAFSGDRRAAHRIIRTLYGEFREIPRYRKSIDEAIAAVMDAWLKVNWGPSSSLGGREYYRNGSLPFGQEVITDGRPLCEIGWTAGGPMAYPFALAEDIVGLTREDFGTRKNHADLIDMICAAYNPDSGFFNELTLDWRLARPYWDKVPLNKTSRNNGWWAGYLVGNQHTAYNNGSACYYILKTIDLLRRQGRPVDPEWQPAVLRVLETAMSLQRADGNYGFAYSETRPGVELWDGFAGCWFSASCAMAAKLTGDPRFAESARRGIDYYYRFVKELNCYGTPMDTYLSVDQEGVLAFIRACRVLHEVTGEPALLEYLNDGAEYEYLWRYGFRARPEHEPLKSGGWNSCGGSGTSVSNPHLHPMAVTVAAYLRYLADRTGDDYHRQRADDSIAWAMQCLEIFPDIAGCGRYGVMTERFCPSDGLVVDKNPDRSPSSIWRCYNGWAAAAILEGLCEERNGVVMAINILAPRSFEWSGNSGTLVPDYGDGSNDWYNISP